MAAYVGKLRHRLRQTPTPVASLKVGFGTLSLAGIRRADSRGGLSVHHREYGELPVEQVEW